MRALVAGGNTAEAVRAYEELRPLLREELGIVPCPETLQLHSELLIKSAPPIGWEAQKRGAT
ncbi:MAG: Bacterial transcriptional activator domain [Conexibacter sp.]|nr:Bacterial transcriptional activator domain [Conexibacter sp.]